MSLLVEAILSRNHQRRRNFSLDRNARQKSKYTVICKKSANLDKLDINIFHVDNYFIILFINYYINAIYYK